MKKFVTTLGIAAAILAAAVHAQQVRDQSTAPKAGSAGVSGVVVTDEQTPQPIRRAAVNLMNADGGVTKQTFTNEAGRFSIAGLPAGRYTLNVSKAPYLTMAYGAKRPEASGTSITLTNTSQMTDIVMRLPRGSVISGRIVDENGDPAFGVAVRSVRSRMVNGERTFTMPAIGSANDTTDDRGTFRMFGLAPGEYIVIATPRATNGEIKAMTEDEIRAVMQALQQQQAARANAQAAQTSVVGYGAPTPTPTPTPTPKPDTNKVTVAYAPVYYPGTTQAATASAVTVASGEERGGIDFALRIVRTAKVEGQVMVPAGIAPQSVQLMMVPASQVSAPGVAQMAGIEQMLQQRVTPGADGKFAYNGVAPGSYIISARAVRSAGAANGPPPPPPPPPPPGANVGFATTRVMVTGGDVPPEFSVMPFVGPPGDPNATQFWAQVEVPVDGMPVSGVTLALQPGMTISGRIEFRSTLTRPGADFKAVQLTATLVSSPSSPRLQLGAPSVQIDDKGQFTISGVVPGKYRLAGSVMNTPNQGPPTGPPWRVGSAVVKGRDCLDFAFDVGPSEDVTGALVTFTDATQDITGTLQDASGRPAPDYTIIAFPADKALWSSTRRIRTVRPSTDGRYTLTNLPAGEYLLSAVTDLMQGEQNDPAFLEQVVPAAIKLTVATGEKKVQDLRISGGL